MGDSEIKNEEVKEQNEPRKKQKKLQRMKKKGVF